MAGSSKIGVPWPHLPKELLQKIAKFLESETDVLRFRAVCTSWRSSATPFKKSPFTPLKLPFPFDAGGETPHPKDDGAYFSLADRIVYRLQLPNCKEPSSWLVKVENLIDGKFRLLNPLSDHPIKIQPETSMPKVLNTLNFRVSEICRAYTLHYVNPSHPKRNDEYKYAKKVAVSAENNDYTVVAIDDHNKLWYIKSGHLNWTLVPDNDCPNSFLDVVYYKGQFYAIDMNGRAVVFDSMFKRNSITYILSSGASKRRLLDLYGEGELYLVEGLTDKDKRICKCYDIDSGCQCRFPNTPIKNTVVEIIIYKMDKQKYKWIEAKMVIDRIIFAGDDCAFSLSTKEFEGCNGTRVFYTDQHFFFRTEEEKVVYNEIFENDYDCDYGYDYFECDCCCSSDDETEKFDDFVPPKDVKVKLRGLHGHNSGVCDFESGKIGSLLRFPEYSDIFWPPPSWIR